MKNNAKATLANFNCTIKKEKNTIPMLEFFNEIIYPALNNTKKYKETKRNKYYISDLKLVELTDGPMALVGKHIKRTVLDIFPDYNAESGFIGEQFSAPSAPHSNFILLLNNHRLIYYSNEAGAPTVSSFSTTVGHMIYTYVKDKRNDIIQNLKELKPSEAKAKNATYIDEKNNQIKYFRYEYKDEYYKNIADFSNRYLDEHLPYPETNVVAIESQTLLEEAFKNIKKINKVEFKFYKPNNDPLDFDNLFEQTYSILEKSNSTSVKTTLNSPEEKSVIETAIASSKGKTSYQIQATNNENEPIQLNPDSVSEKVVVDVGEWEEIEKESSHVYNQLKEKTAIKEISESNQSLYLKLKSFIASLM